MVKHILISKNAVQDLEMCVDMLGNSSNTIVKVYRLKGLNLKHVKTINCLKIDTAAGVLKELEDLEDGKYQIVVLCKGNKFLSIRTDIRTENVR